MCACPDYSDYEYLYFRDYEKYVEDSADKRTLDSKAIEEKEGMKAGPLGWPARSFSTMRATTSTKRLRVHDHGRIL